MLSIRQADLKEVITFCTPLPGVVPLLGYPFIIVVLDTISRVKMSCSIFDQHAWLRAIYKFLAKCSSSKPILVGCKLFH